MGNFRKVKKKSWRLNDLLRIAENEFERNAVEFGFEKLATKNTAGEMAIDCRGVEINGTWVLINLQAIYMEHFIGLFMSEKGYKGMGKEDSLEFHEMLTRLLGGLNI